MRSLLVFCLATLLGGCWRRSSTIPLPARGPVRDSLVGLDGSRGDSVAARGQLEGMLSLMAPEVVFLRAGVPATYGRAAVQKLFRASPATAGTSFHWQPIGADLSADRRSAYTYGVAITATPQARPPIRGDRYIAFWQREPSLPWRIVAYAEVGGPSVDVQLSAEETAPPMRTAPRRMAELLTRLRSTDSSFSDLADRMGVAAAFGEYVAPEGAVFSGTELVIGPREMREYYFAQSAGTSLTWTPVFAGGASSEDLGFTVGSYVSTGRGPTGAAVQRFGKYLTVWKRQRDGSWRFVIDGGSPHPGRSSER